MPPLMTVDANILVYSVDERDSRKHNIATRVVEFAKTARSVLTLQSISEFYNVVTRKSYMPARDAVIMVDELVATFNIVSSSPATLSRATALHSTSASKIQFWDAMLLTTANEHGASIIFSEDLTDGSIVGGIEICNPFTAQDLDSRLRKYSL
jgi:predicted nucleic acid-binding protein